MWIWSWLKYGLFSCFKFKSFVRCEDVVLEGRCRCYSDCSQRNTVHNDGLYSHLPWAGNTKLVYRAYCWVMPCTHLHKLCAVRMRLLTNPCFHEDDVTGTASDCTTWLVWDLDNNINPRSFHSEHVAATEGRFGQLRVWTFFSRAILISANA